MKAGLSSSVVLHAMVIGFGLVSLFLLISAIVTALLTKKNASTIKGPDLTMAELRKTQETLAPSKPVE
jgi:multisubunit Na+/H+ antiporter MnhC subunit